MQLSYKVIKNNSVKNNGLKEIITTPNEIFVTSFPDESVNSNLDGYNNMARTILENARRQKEQVLANAIDEARKIEDEATKRAVKIAKDAYESGFNEGKEAGFNKAYKEALEEAEKEKASIIAAAEELLMNAKVEYEGYLENKKSELFDLIVCASEAVLKKELTDKSSINSMIYDALEASKKAKIFIIKCNEIYVEELNTQIVTWKEKLGFNGDIFIIKDNSLENGNAIIDKGNGKVVVGIDYALQRIRELLEGKE